MDEASNVLQTSDNGYFISGYTSSNDIDVTGNHGMKDFWVVKTDDNGILQWQKCLGGQHMMKALLRNKQSMVDMSSPVIHILMMAT